MDFSKVALRRGDRLRSWRPPSHPARPETAGAYTRLSSPSLAETRRLEAQTARWQAEPIRQLRYHVGADADTVADIGGGAGAAIPLLAAEGFRSVINLDRMPDMLARSARVARTLGVKLEPIEVDFLDPTSVATLQPRNLPAAISGFTATHVGLEQIFGVGSALLGPSGMLAITDIDYGGMRVSGAREVNRLRSAVQELVIHAMGDLARQEAIAARAGFETVMSMPTAWRLRGDEVLSMFAFVDTMNAATEALALRTLLDEARTSPSLSAARLDVQIHRTLFRKEPH